MEQAIDADYYIDMCDDSLFGSPGDASFIPGRRYDEFSLESAAVTTGKTADNKAEDEISPGTVVKSSAVCSLPLPAPATTVTTAATVTTTHNPTPPPALELDIPEDAGQSLFVPQNFPAGDVADIEFPDLSYFVPQSAIGQLLDTSNHGSLWDATKQQTQTQPQLQFDFAQWQMGVGTAGSTFQFPDAAAGFQFHNQRQQQQPQPPVLDGPNFQPVYYQQPLPQTITTTSNPVLPPLLSPSTPRRSPRNTRKYQSTLSNGSTIILGHPPTPPPLIVAKKIEHKRGLKNAEDNRPQDVYKPRPPRTKWGPFRYQDVGVELYPLMYFTSDQIVDFITNREANKRRKLTIWIQNAPAQVNNRYHMGTNSSKCRWASCPGPRNTILKGFWRVAFDEDSNQTGHRYDPFLNAGYMHLFCFEECFNLGFMIHASRYLGFKVEADVRDFPFESRNPMSITRDHEQLLGVYKRFVSTQRAKYPVLGDERQLKSLGRQWIKSTAFSPAGQNVPASERLWRQLTEAHLSHEVATRHVTRENRGGANIGHHRGDLRVYMQLKRAGGAQVDLAIPATNNTQKNKRKRGGAAAAGAEVIAIDDDDEEDGNRPRPVTTTSSNSTSARRRIHRGNVPNPLVIPPHYPQQQQQQAVARGGRGGGGRTADGEFDLDDFSGVAPPCAIPRHMTMAHAPGPRGRESETIMDVITSPVRMTRRTSQALQTRLNSQPKFVQKQVLAVIPDHMKEIFFDGNLDNNNNGGEAGVGVGGDGLIFGQSSKDGLEQRLARLPAKVRAEVDEFARRREKNARELASF